MRAETPYLAVDRASVLHPYTSMTDPLPTYPVRRAAGVHMELEDGSQLLDGMSSWWAAVHGYRHPALDAALKAQVDDMAHVMFGGLTHAPAATLAELLVRAAPPGLDKVFLCDSGSVSVEVALKMALQYWHTVSGGETRKKRFLTLANGYHGDTFGAMAVCDPVNGMHGMFRGVLPENVFVPAPADASEEAALACAGRLEAALQNHAGELAALIFEPVVQGAGGMRVHSPLLLQRARALCDQYDVLLILDEIATGFCRTGATFACAHTPESFQPYCASKAGAGSARTAEKKSGSTPDDKPGSTPEEEEEKPGSTDGRPAASQVPDILCVGKALTGGYMTMGATLANERVAQGISGGERGGVFMHGPTFMGNPLACAVAAASLRLLLGEKGEGPQTAEVDWRGRVAATASTLVEGLAPLADHAKVKEVRVLGAIGVCELQDPVKDMAEVQHAFVQRGVWLRPFGKLLYTMPPFMAPALTQDHVATIATAIRDVVASDAI